MTHPQTARIEVFRTGTFTPMGGAPLSFSAADLKAMADAYDPATAPAPIVVGHPSTDAPAYGWAERFEFDAAADRLYAHVGQIEPAFGDAVKAGRYKKVSLAFHAPGAGANPRPGSWYPKHVGFLGGAAPAVPGLANVHFAGDDAVVFSDQFAAADETAGILRSLREFLIEKFGMEDADRALPSWRIEWLAESETRPGFAAAETAGSDAPEPAAGGDEPPADTSISSKKDPAMSDAAFADREAALVQREAALREREMRAVHAEHVAFADALVGDGRLLAASRDRMVAVLDAVHGAGQVAFADGESMDIGAAIRALFAGQPQVVPFGRIDAAAAVAPDVAFAADGQRVAHLDQLARARAYQAEHPGADFLTAVKAVA